MALIQCPECSKEISDTAKSCPNCGFPVAEKRQKEGKPSVTAAPVSAQKKSGLPKKALIVIGAILVLGVIGSIMKSPDEKTADTEKKEAPATAKGYQLSENEKRLMNAMMNDDINSFINGGNSLVWDLTKDIVRANAIDVAITYAKNQVAGDQKYYKKTVFLTGRVMGVQSGLGNRPYITLAGVNQFQSPHVEFKRDVSIERIADIQPGSSEAFICKGNGAVVGTPMFDDCVFADDFAIGIYKSKFDSDEFQKIKVGIIAALSLLPAESSCLAPTLKIKDCINEINGIDKKRFDTAKIEARKKMGLKPEPVDEPKQGVENK